MATRLVLGVVLVVAAAGCSRDHGRGEDGGIDAEVGGDGGMCGAIRCEAGCTVVTGPDGCAMCRCEPVVETCATDADCVIAFDLAQCCGSCPWGYRADRVEAERCLVRAGDYFPADCRPAGCGDDCPAIDCAYPPRAACEGGMCVGVYECAASEVVFRNECTPRCTTHADCVIAEDVTQCCGRTCDAYPRALTDERPCWVAEGESGGGSCPVPPDHCAGLGCATMECPSDAHAACMNDFTCGFVEGPEPCPPGYVDVSGRCLAEGG
jgi:hypothetical protein